MYRSTDAPDPGHSCAEYLQSVRRDGLAQRVCIQKWNCGMMHPLSLASGKLRPSDILTQLLSSISVVVMCTMLTVPEPKGHAKKTSEFHKLNSI